MTVLLLSVYVLTVTAVYERVRSRFPGWQLRAEISGQVAGLTLWLGLGAYVGGVL